jgi:cytochrome c5
VRTIDKLFSLFIAFLIGLVGFGILITPSRSNAQTATSHSAAALGALVHGLNAFPAAAALPASSQDAGQSSASTTTASAPKPVELPEGDGKPIATEYCQMCHKLTNLTKAHKSLDDWKDTINTMIERGASIPDDKIDTLAAYLAKNFGPQEASAAPSAGSAATTPAPATGAAPAASAAAKPVELPDGEGKEVAVENCQACHKLTNITKSHKDLDDWKETVQTMIDRGANVPPDKVDVLVQYLAKNFGPNQKDTSAPASGSSPSPTN